MVDTKSGGRLAGGGNHDGDGASSGVWGVAVASAVAALGASVAWVGGEWGAGCSGAGGVGGDLSASAEEGAGASCAAGDTSGMERFGRIRTYNSSSALAATVDAPQLG